MRRTTCLGACPDYSVEIYQDGTVHYLGREYVSAVGARTTRVTPVAVDKLIAEFVQAGYMNFNSSYRTITNPDGSVTTVTDQPTTFTSLTLGGQKKEVEDYAFAPESLGELELEVDRVADTHRWVHGEDDLKEWQIVGDDIYRRTKPGLTVLMQASGKGDLSAMEKEHPSVADINAQDETGWTALMLASAECEADAVAKLLDWGARVDLKDKRGDTALIAVAAGFCYEDLQRVRQTRIVEMLIAKGADPNESDNAGETALMAVTQYGNVDALRSLLDSGARLDLRDRRGRTALDYAKEAQKKYTDHGWTDYLPHVVRILENHGGLSERNN